MSETLNFGMVCLRMVVALGIVCVVAYFILSKIVPRAMRANLGTGRMIKVVDYFRLEPKKTLYIIEVEGEYILIGVTEQMISPLVLTQLNQEAIKKVVSQQTQQLQANKRQEKPGMSRWDTKDDENIRKDAGRAAEVKQRRLKLADTSLPEPRVPSPDFQENNDDSKKEK
ncbi:MAG: flagellar biosynthetic protein FliO [bacterium]